ncbi:RapZ C-terminal domain-containing protein [Rhodococcus qingshengii]|uniref:RapZ C-terminal domain-containing protein n=1 Tax=Rhodococcus qingshengii TaxID=334542 RepID=UPI0037030860
MTDPTACRTGAADRPPIELVSFGFLHLDTDHQGRPVLPYADRIEDVRDRLRDPAAARTILDLDGHHPRVQNVVLATPGARELLDNLTDYATLPAGPRRIAIGCAGGKHRACALIELLAQRLTGRNVPVTVTHHHAHLPRVLKN